MNSYHDAKTLLDLRKRQGHPRAKLHKNVYLEPRDNDVIAVRYHDTEIVVYYPDGRIELHSGGWRTASTKKNLNIYSPFHVYQEKGVWYVYPDPIFTNAADVQKFVDGMILPTPEWVTAA